MCLRYLLRHNLLKIECAIIDRGARNLSMIAHFFYIKKFHDYLKGGEIMELFEKEVVEGLALILKVIVVGLEVWIFLG